MPGFLDNLFRTPPFNPMSLRDKKKPLPMGGKPIATEISGPPAVQAPRPLPLPTGSIGQLTMSAPPDPNREYTNYRPMTMAANMGTSKGTVAPSSVAPLPATTLDHPKPEVVPIPRLPGYGGGTVPDNPYDRQKYDYVMQGAKRNPDNTFAGDKIGFKRSGKDIGEAALLGLRDRGIPGALIGALTGVLSPQHAREQNFEALYAPGIQQQEQRRQATEDRNFALKKAQTQLEQEEAQTQVYKAQAAKAGKNNYQLSGGVIYNPQDLKDYQIIQGLPRNPREDYIESPRGIFDIKKQSFISGSEPEPKPVSVAPGASLVNPKTGQTLMSAPPRPSSMRVPREGREAGDKAQRLKMNAEAAWNTAKSLPEGSEERLQAENVARDALSRYNQAVEGLGNVYSDLYETGEGNQGWRYFKQRGQAGAQSMRAGAKTSRDSGKKGIVGPNILKGVAQDLGVDENEAARQLEADGYTVRRQ